jgi:hypothetical protein
MRRTWFALLVLSLLPHAVASAAEADGPVEYGEPKQLARLADRSINESSGLAVSRRNKGIFWTHNDSGGTARIYAIDADGNTCATFTLIGAKNRDWEDIAAYELDGTPYLVVADIGDNGKRRSVYVLYIVEEPEVDARRRNVQEKLRLSQLILFKYPDGSQDGEGMAVAPHSKTIFVATRNYRPRCDVYSLPLPEKQPGKGLTATHVARLKITVGNAMDISPDGRRAVIGTYHDAYEFTRRGAETWADAMKRKPRKLSMPKRRKGEAIAYGTDGKTLYLTSEGTGAPLWMVPAKNGD